MTDAPAAPVTDTAAPPPPAPETVAAVSAADWKAALPDDVKSDPGLQKYTSIEALAKGYLNVQKMIGSEKVPVPKTEDDWARWYDAAGRPKEPTGYEFKEVQLPEGMNYNTELEGAFKTVAHQAGLNVQQAQALRDWFASQQGEAFTSDSRAAIEARNAAELSLKRELGNAYDGYVNAAKAALSEYTSPEFVAFLDQSGLGNHPELVKAFGRIGRETLGETKLKSAGVAVEPTAAELDVKIADFRTSNREALYDKTHPDHARLTAELTRLYSARFPDEPR